MEMQKVVFMNKELNLRLAGLLYCQQTSTSARTIRQLL